MNEDNENLLVCKANKLIEASYKLNAGEQKIVLAVASMVNPYDEDFKEYFISIQKFADLLGVDINKNKDFYSRLKKKTYKLKQKVITIHESDGDLQVSWFSSIKYFDKEGRVRLRFDPALKPYLLKLKEYTKYKLLNISNLNSGHSIRVYELLKQYEKIGIRQFEINDFKNKIGLETNQYPRFYDLKNRVLLVAQRELKEKTDISFEFEKVKKGRSIYGIKFFITSSKVQEEIAAALVTNLEYIDNVKNIFTENITSIEAKKLLDAAQGNIHLIEEKYKLSKKCSSINNIVGWVISAIKQDYKKSKQNANKDSFTDYEQRSYDFDELEKKLLGWNVE